MFKKRKFWN